MNWLFILGCSKEFCGSRATRDSHESDDGCGVESKSKKSSASDRLMHVCSKQVKYVVSDEEDESNSDDLQISNGSDGDFRSLNVLSVSLLTCFRSSFTPFSDFVSLSFLTNNSSSDSKTFLRFYSFSGSPAAVHRAFLFFDAKAWPQSLTSLFTCTTVLHCEHTLLFFYGEEMGHTFLNLS